MPKIAVPVGSSGRFLEKPVQLGFGNPQVPERVRGTQQFAVDETTDGLVRDTQHLRRLAHAEGEPLRGGGELAGLASGTTVGQLSGTWGGMVASIGMVMGHQGVSRRFCMQNLAGMPAARQSSKKGPVTRRSATGLGRRQLPPRHTGFRGAARAR